MTGVDPTAAVVAAVRAVARAPQPVGLFAESSSAMFYVTRALREFEPAPYVRFSTHYGSMGHANAAPIGFCAATGHRALVVTGDGSFELMSPLACAVLHGYAITMVVLNDSRLGLPFFGSDRLGAMHARDTTGLAEWDFTRQGSKRIAGRRVQHTRDLDGAIAEALAYNGCFVVDVRIDPDVVPPVGARLGGVAALFGERP